MGLEPLKPVTRRKSLTTVRGMPRPALDGYIKELRKQFQLQNDALCIDGRRSWFRIYMWRKPWWSRTMRCVC